jgi:hypothetical protein
VANKEKDKQHSGQQGKGQITQWPTRKRTNNTVANKEKDKQHSGQQGKGQTTQWLFWAIMVFGYSC